MKRQGDLLIVKVKQIPQGASKQKNRVLAEGEATGHLHELDQGEVYEENGVMYFKVEQKPTTLHHPEHKPLLFEEGIYKVIRQREYQPTGWKYVRD